MLMDEHSIERFDFELFVVNAKFTEMQMNVRYIFMMAAFVTMVAYLCKYFDAKRKGFVLSYDQHSVAQLVVFVVFFDDPLYAFEILKPQYRIYIFSSMWTALFVGTLLKYWIHLPEQQFIEARGNQGSQNQQPENRLNSRSVIGFLKELFFFIVILDIFMVISLYQYEVDQHPSTSNMKDWPTILKLTSIVFVIFLCLYMVWYLFIVLFLVIKCCKIPLRQKISFVLQLLLLCVWIGTIFEGTFTTMYSNGSTFVVFLFTFNLYVFMLAYLHWPVIVDQNGVAGPEVEMHDQFAPVDQADVVLDY